MGLQFARAFCGLFVLLGISQVLLAQENYKNASIAVRVTDPSGAAVKNAEVRFVEQARGDHGIKRTDKTGWVLAELKPGDYEIKVTGSGSKSKVIRYAEVTAAEHKQLEVSLEA